MKIKQEILGHSSEFISLCKEHQVGKLYAFGSSTRDDFNDESDIDILVDFNKKIDAFEYIRLAHELEDLFQQKIDVVSRKGIKPHYLKFVEKNLIHV